MKENVMESNETSPETAFSEAGLLLREKLTQFRFRALETIMRIYILLSFAQLTLVFIHRLFAEGLWVEIFIMAPTLIITLSLYHLRKSRPQISKNAFLLMLVLVQVIAIFNSEPIISLVWVCATGCFLCVVFALLETQKNAFRYSLAAALSINFAFVLRALLFPKSLLGFATQLLITIAIASFFFNLMVALMTRWLAGGFIEALQFSEEMSDQLIKSNAALIEAKDAATIANQAKSQFLANMSHELRTPLNAIMGYTEIIQEELQSPTSIDPETLNDDLKNVMNSSQQLLSLIEDILDIEKIESGRTQLNLAPIDLQSLNESLSRNLLPALQKRNNTLHCTLPPPEVELWSDASLLRQLLGNLLDNACKFTHHGTIELNITHALRANGVVLFFRIKDTGIGIENSQAEKIFEAFEQVDMSSTREYGGVGLGLTIAHHLSVLLEGTLSLESTPGEGTTFTLELPQFHSQSPLLTSTTPTNNELSIC